MESYMDKPIKSVAMSPEMPTRFKESNHNWLNDRAKYEAEVERVKNVLSNWGKK